MPSFEVECSIHRLARTQHGVFSRRQAMSVGATSSLVQRRVAAGRWVPLGPGVYAVPGAPNTWEQRQQAACLAAGASAVVSHRAAAVLQGFPGFRPGPTEISVPYTVGSHRPGRVHRVNDLGPDDVTVVRGIPATTRLRTLLDLAGVVPQSILAATLDDLLAARVLDFEEVVTAAGAYVRHGKQGSAALRRVLAERGPGYVPPESELERRLLAVLRAGGLPVPESQHPLPGFSGTGRVDFAYPAARLLLEADGRRWHTRASTLRTDRRRDNEAAALGWRTLRLGWDDVLTRPEWVCEVVRRSIQPVLGASMSGNRR